MKLISIIFPITKIDNLTFPALNSLINQSCNINYEIIIIIDKNDHTIKEILNDFYKEYVISKKIIFIENHVNFGLTKSLNIAIGQSNGKFILRNDQDDISALDRINECIKIIDKKSNIKFIYSDFNSKKNFLIKRKVNFFGLKIHKILNFKNPISHSSTFFEKELFYKVGGYDERLVTSQDFDLWYRFLSYDQNCSYYIKKSLVTINYPEDSISKISEKKQRIMSVILCLRNTFKFKLTDHMINNPSLFINDLIQNSESTKIKNKLISLVYCYLYDENQLKILNFNYEVLILILINYLLHPNLLIKRLINKLF